MSDPNNRPIRALGFIDAFSLVVGTIIGTGIFLKTSVMTRDVGSGTLVLIVWLAAGLLSLAGALSYAELGSRFPESGGEFVYLRNAYGDLTAFLYGWMRLVVGSTGSIAALAVGLGIVITSLLGLANDAIQIGFGGAKIELGSVQLIAVAAIALTSAVNCAGVALGGRLQTVLMFAKVIPIAVIVVGVLVLAPDGSASIVSPEPLKWPGISAFGAAMIAALWAYDGWNNMPMVAGEIRNPKRNIPAALFVGTIAVIAVYIAVNVAYFEALPFDAIVSATDSDTVATRAAATFLGDAGTAFVGVAIALSIAGALNGTLLTGARVPFSMAECGLFPKSQARLGSRLGSPVQAILVQAVWASVLALLGTFDQLTNYAVFSMWIFYILATASIFIFRRREDTTQTQYRVPLYPLTPVLFICVGTWLLVNTIWTSPFESAAGTVLIVSGVPFFFVFRRRSVSNQTSN